MTNTEIDTVINQTVTLEGFAGIDEMGDPSYNPPANLRAYVARRLKMIRSFTGAQTVSTGSLVLSPDIVLDSHGRDRITLPDGTQPVILAISDVVDDTGQRQSIEIAT